MASELPTVVTPRWSSKKQRWTKRMLKKHLPITRWLPQYTSEQWIADLIAGITVGLTVMPQALAYATLAGLEPQVFTYVILLHKLI